MFSRGPRRSLQAGDVDLVVEVADVAHDGLVLHAGHVLQGNDLALPVAVTNRSARGHHVLQGGHLVALHGRLEGADGIDLGDDHSRPLSAQGLGAPLAHLAVAAHHGHLAAQHDVGGPHEAVGQRVPAAVDVVELALGHRVVDVDGREEEGALLHHVVEAVHAGGRLLGDAAQALGDFRPPARVRGQLLAQQGQDDAPLLGVVGRVEGGHAPAFSNSAALWTSRVASPPSSRSRVGPAPSGKLKICSVHHQYSGERLALPGEHRGAARGRRRSPTAAPPRPPPRDPASKRYCRTPSAPRHPARAGSR